VYWYTEKRMRTLLHMLGADAIHEVYGWFFCPKIFVGKLGLLAFSMMMASMCTRRRAFIVTDQYVKHLADKVAQSLRTFGFQVQIWDRAVPEPPLETVQECAEDMKKFEPDLIIAVGGGSVIDTAKAAWVLYERPGTNLKMLNPLFPVGLRVKARLVACPTTSGTGSETTYAAVLTDTSQTPPRKLEIASLELVPDYAILLPEFAAGMPPKLTVGTGLDALAHAVDAYFSSMATEFTDAIALKAIELILKYLPRAYRNPKDMEARYKMHIAATMGGIAFSNSGTALTHSLGHAVGKAFGIHHGISVGIFIPYVIPYYAKATDRYIDLAKYLGIEAKTNEEYLKKLVDLFKDFLRSLDVSYVLKDHGISREDFEKNLDVLAKYAYEDAVTPASPRPTSVEELRKLLIYAYEGKDVDF